jgi:hypothetical protein
VGDRASDIIEISKEAMGLKKDSLDSAVAAIKRCTVE